MVMDSVLTIQGALQHLSNAPTQTHLCTVMAEASTLCADLLIRRNFGFIILIKDTSMSRCQWIEPANLRLLDDWLYRLISSCP